MSKAKNAINKLALVIKKKKKKANKRWNVKNAI